MRWSDTSKYIAGVCLKIRMDERTIKRSGVALGWRVAHTPGLNVVGGVMQRNAVDSKTQNFPLPEQKEF